MERIRVKFIKWLSNKFGYKIVMLKAAKGVWIFKEIKNCLDT